MATAKKTEFKNEDQVFANFAKALSHPARIAILRVLAEKNCICGEIVEILPLAQSTVSQHLKELKRLGLIKGEVEGVKSCYCLNWDVVDSFAGQTSRFFRDLEQYRKHLECCPDRVPKRSQKGPKKVRVK